MEEKAGTEKNAEEELCSGQSSSARVIDDPGNVLSPPRVKYGLEAMNEKLKLRKMEPFSERSGNLLAKTGLKRTTCTKTGNFKRLPGETPTWKKLRNDDSMMHKAEGSSGHRMQLKQNYPIRGRWGNNQHKVLPMCAFLEEISQFESYDVLARIKCRMGPLLEHLKSNLEPRFIPVLLKVFAKVCNSSFDESKECLLIEVCNSNFIVKLQEYLMALPDADKLKADYYWDYPDSFWRNLVVICESIILLSPSTALHNCRVLIKRVIDSSLNALKEEHDYTISEDLTKRLDEVKKQIAVLEKKADEETKKYATTRHLAKSNDKCGPPPDDFRELSILPTVEDLLGQMPYVRPNIVEGSYTDVDHYLDVQFRLLREDCYGPLREGIRQYLKDPSKKRFDNIRTYKQVTMLEPYYSKEKIGILVQFNTNKSRIKWAQSKRFMFGSMLLFTNDNCNTFVVATVIERDFILLDQGQVPVSVYGTNDTSLSNLLGKSFTMIESEVYFEPYYHVLKALKDPVFARDLAMKNYIVHVHPTTNPPKYLKPTTKFTVPINGDNGSPQVKRFTVLEEGSWPSACDLGLDQTQYDAYKLALTQEFSVIQGPPGTGKTYLGVLAARTLFENLEFTGCVMLVICYTNHALDQFLEAILNITQSVVRIGGQSKSESLKEFNLSNLRKNRRSNFDDMNVFYGSTRRCLEQLTLTARNMQNNINTVNNGLVGLKDLSLSIYDVKRLEKTYGNETEDPILAWLFQDAERLFGGDDGLWFEPQNIRCDFRYTQNIDNNRSVIIIDDMLDEDKVLLGNEMTNIFKIDDINNYIAQCRTELARGGNIEYRQKLNLWIARLKCFEANRPLRNRECTLRISDRRHPNQFSNVERWAIYFKWVNALKDKFIKGIVGIEEDHRRVSREYEEARMIVDRKLLKTTRVIGMTTTGAARLQKLVRSLKPPIVIVEEAAEVLESHIVVSLTSHCEHLILIGDHQQLRPSASHFKLAKHYNMEISLFERMITNGIHSRRLGVQHRMRPSIASLITPAIYPELRNHATVERLPHVRGFAANLFFLTHTNQEDGVDDDNSSRRNTKEADLTLQLANYIMLQGYEPEDVTILAAYSGQMFYMKQKQNTYSRLMNIKITVVDNFQGEESKIILLSLVRNNAEGNIGFLGNANRICVALSRAKEGFYILGNMDMLKNKSDLWKTISETMENQAALGTSIRLRCENHPDQIIEARETADFLKAPEGGCLLKCVSTLACGHVCPLICHAYDREHEQVTCSRNCERVCELGHICPLPCADKCEQCQVQMIKLLPCGHVRTISCHLAPTDPGIKCLRMVEVILPACQHKVLKNCFLDVKKAPCKEPCIDRLPCGHACTKCCHKTDDPDHLDYTCKKPCTNLKKGCMAVPVEESELEEHSCQKRCYETCEDCNVEVMKKHSDCGHSELVKCGVDVNTKPCRKNCKRSMPCGHVCKNKCHEPCGNCMQKVKTVIPGCGHEVELLCKYEPSRKYCGSKCERTLPCGHPCTLDCRAPCDPRRCTAPAMRAVKSPCGHSVQVPCHMYNGGLVAEEALLRHCAVPCEQTLACKHRCGGTCGACRQGRLHAPCTQPCLRALLCGHLCEEPCNDVCPPCKKPCEVRCGHTRCSLPCGESCVPCKEKCTRKCVHRKCTRNCGNKCSRAACNKPCPLKRPCGHRCRGLCGELCPDICNICDPDNFPKDFLGDDFNDDAKFIRLQDCKAKKGHYMEVTDMDNLMSGDQETVMVRACPYCRTPIVNTLRYKDLISATFRQQIEPIKRKVYGNKNVIIREKKLLLDDLTNMLAKYPKTASGVEIWKTVTHEIKHKLTLKTWTRRLVLSLPELNMHSVSVNILDMLAECYEEYGQRALTKLRDELIQQVAMICRTLQANTCKISVQQQTDIGLEIKRIRATIQLARLTDAIPLDIAEPEIQEAIQVTTGLILTWERFDYEKARLSLAKLQQSVKLSEIVLKVERDLVVRAIGLKQGHWFKCPKGHFYCIGECGGAMERSKCVECGAAIGGSSHKLLSDNRHAPELDGSSHPAWSNTANNMRNFQF